jgi:transposase-like protein
MKEKRTFSSEQKARIVLSVITKEVTALEASKNNNIAPSLVYKWQEEFLAKALHVFATQKGDTEKDKKLRHYEHVISKITTQNDFLEKVLAVTK